MNRAFDRDGKTERPIDPADVSGFITGLRELDEITEISVCRVNKANSLQGCTSVKAQIS